MIKNSSFWETGSETKAPIWDHNYNFITQENVDDICKRAQQWLQMVKEPDQLQQIDATLVDEEPNKERTDHRILIHDYERTFLHKDNRLLMFKALNTLLKQHMSGDYSQSLGYAASFLLLTLDLDSTIKLLAHLNKNPLYVPGYWKSEAIACATDGLLFFHTLVAKYHGDIYTHLVKNGIMPQTYVQKWFSALCLHVLPFESLFLFWEKFLTQGFTFLFQFGLSLMDRLKDQFLATSNISNLFGLLRLDPKVVKGDLQQIALDIVQNADKFDVNSVVMDYTVARQETYNKYLKESIERSRAQMQNVSDDEEDLSDDDEDDDDDDDKDAK